MASNDENTKLVVNQHYDESLDVNDSEEIASLYSPSPRKTPTPLLQPGPEKPKYNKMSSQDDDDQISNEFGDNDATDGSPGDVADPQAQARSGTSTMSEGDSSEDSDSSSGDEENGTALEGAYDPADYEGLNVSVEIKDLFQYITRYTPQTIELEHKLKPFIPEYIPAVGDIDAFIKVSKPDNSSSLLGLTVLDEPCAKQSDPTVLDLQLRSISKMSGIKAMQVRSLKDAQTNPKSVESWIESIEDLRRTKLPQNVHYTKSMPDIEQLMQEWPPEFEALLSKVRLPSADLDCDLQKYIDMICAVLDIPIYPGNKVQSLHVLFSLYMEFKNSQHFQTASPNEHHDVNEPDVMTFD
ncbi:intraflagellar transport protein 46 homolog [Styela clava]